jgi:hypothetical protein
VKEFKGILKNLRNGGRKKLHRCGDSVRLTNAESGKCLGLSYTLTYFGSPVTGYGKPGSHNHSELNSLRRTACAI